MKKFGLVARETLFAAYSVQCNYGFKRNEPLGKINGKIDLFELLAEYCKSMAKVVSENQETSELVYFDNLLADGRSLSGFVHQGTFGKKGSIVRRQKGRVFDKTVDDADMLRFYFRVYIPNASDTGFLVAETFGNAGIASIFQRDFVAFAKSKHPSIGLKINRVAPEKYLESILGAGEVSSVRFVRTRLIGDESEKLEKLGIHEDVGSIEYEIKPKKDSKFQLLGALKKRLAGNKGEDGLVTVVGDEWKTEKTLITLDVNGRSRTVQLETLGIGRPNIEAQLERDADGLPYEDQLHNFSQGLINDLMSELNKS